MAIRNILKGKQDISNPSLILHKYLEIPAGDDKDSSSRNDLISKAVSSLSKVKDIYTQAYNRWKNNLPTNVIKKDLNTNGNMIVGLGSDNVLETGITLHHTYGVPYIPGTALKGLAAHYCNEVLGKQDEKFLNESKEHPIGDYYREIFGDTTQKGHITFWDAWIIPGNLVGCLKKDIMTPHNTSYYSATDNTAPSDYESPNPISFISVQGTFTIALSCDVENENGQRWLELTFNILKNALEQWGVGAKTSSGYGRLSSGTYINQSNNQNIQQQAKPTYSDALDQFKKEIEKNKNWLQKPQQSTIVQKIQAIKDVNLQKQAKEYIKQIIKEKDRSKTLVTFLEQ